MSTATNDNLMDLAAEVLADVEQEWSDGTMPRPVEATYGLLQTAVKRNDMDGIYTYTHELGQFLANNEESV